MPLLKITEEMKSPVNAMIFDLFHKGSLTVGGREIRLGTRALPVPVVKGDCIVWTFAKPVKVSTPGPDQSVYEIRQYRDRIELSIGMLADVTIMVKE